jgi:hypothetical protein
MTTPLCLKEVQQQELAVQPVVHRPADGHDMQLHVVPRHQVEQVPQPTDGSGTPA